MPAAPAVGVDATTAVVALDVVRSPSTPAPLVGVVRTSIIVYLEQAGYRVIERPSARQDDANREPWNEYRDDRSVDFLLEASIDGGTNDVRVVLSLLDFEDEMTLGESTAEIPVTLSLDRSIAALVENLFAERAGEMEDVLDRRLARQPVPDRPVSEHTPPLQPAAPVERPTVEPRLEYVRIDRDDTVRALVSAGFSPLLSLGTASRYYAYGHAASANVIFIPRGTGAFGVGLMLRAGSTSASGTAAAGDIRFFPIGLVAELLGQPARLVPYVRVAVGAAFFVLDNPILGRSETFMPYGSTQLGVRLHVLPFLGFEVAMGAEALLDGTTPLLHFNPGILVLAVFR